MGRIHPVHPAQWFIAFGAAVGVWLLAASPSVLGAGAGAGVREAFSLVCHQLADRSPHVLGAQWALCHRCTGLLGGVVVGLAIGPWLPARLYQLVSTIGSGRLLLLTAIPTTADWLLGATGLWANTPVSRFGTGALLGIGAGWLLVDALRSDPSPTLSTHPTS